MSEEYENTSLGTDLRHGSWGKGIAGAIRSLFVIVVIPLIMVYLLEGYITELLAGMSEGMEMDLGGIFESFTGLIYRFAIYGIPIVILSFFLKFYAKGNKGRLLFMLINLAYSIGWLFLIFEGGYLSLSLDLSSMMGESGGISLGDVDILLALQGVIAILVGLILIRMVIAFTSYKSKREKYLKEFWEGRADKDYAPNVDTSLGTDLRNGSWGKGLLSLLIASIFVVVIPYLIVTYYGGTTDLLPAEFAEFEEFIDMLIVLLERIYLFGIPIVALSFFTKFYAKGNKGRLLFSMVSLTYSIFWLLMIFDLGGFVIPYDVSTLFTDTEFYMTNVKFVWSIIAVIIGVILLKMVLTYSSYIKNRNKYLRKLEEESDGDQHSD
ncbi:MAG TPA: hypothetical protein VJX93_01515 [Candidatus Methanomethylophilaceae archaeon]|nr:hypothetical protein [Candidatus Methanomethylophilaceae archaeon]